MANQLFATLDPTVRRMRLPGGSNIVVADTVGFIRELPHELVAAFQSTLQEARSANLLLHVIDASDPRRDEYIEQVNSVLAEIGAGDLPQLAVYNKIDRLQLPARMERDAQGLPAQVWISAAQSQGIELLHQAIAERLQLAVQRCWLTLPAGAGATRARLFAAGVVRQELPTDDGAIRLLVELPQAELDQLLRCPGTSLRAAANGSPTSPACAVGAAYLEFSAPPHNAAVRR
jgi:GTP-binding protein HflX